MEIPPQCHASRTKYRIQNTNQNTNTNTNQNTNKNTNQNTNRNTNENTNQNTNENTNQNTNTNTNIQDTVTGYKVLRWRFCLSGTQVREALPLSFFSFLSLPNQEFCCQYIFADCQFEIYFKSWRKYGFQNMKQPLRV